MKLYFLLFFITFSNTVFGQNGLLGGKIEVVNSVPSYGYARPVCGVNHEGNAVVMWGKRNNQDAYVAIQNSTGFGTPTKVNPNGMTVFAQDWVGPDMAVSGKNVFVTFKSQPEKSGFVYVVASDDGGKTFGDTVRVSDNNWSRFPAIAVSSNGKNVFIAYMAFEPDFLEPHYVMCTSTDGGKTFGKEVKASLAPGEVCDCCPADVFTNDDKVIVMFRNNDNNLRDMWAALSTDNGKTFSAVKDVDSTDWYIGGCPSSGPNCFIHNDTLYHTWMSASSGASRVYVGTANASNMNMDLNKKLTPNAVSSTGQNFPIIAGSNGHTAVVWQESTFGVGIVNLMYSSRGTPGLREDKIIRVDDGTTGTPQNPFIHFDGTTFRVVYQNNAQHSIYYKSYTLDANTSISATSTQKSIKLFPNPANSILQIQVQESADVTLFNLQGKPVLKLNCKAGETSLNISELTDGTYFVEIKIANEVSVIPILKIQQ